MKKNDPIQFLFRSTLLLATLMIMTGCCRHYQANSAYHGPEPIPENILKEFAYPKFKEPYSEKMLKQGEKYDIRRIEFPSAYNITPIKHNIRIDYYDIKGKEKTPIILVLPISGGGNTIAKKFAEYFADKGLAVAIVHRQEDFKKNLKVDTIDIFLKQIVFDHMQAVDWVEMQPDVDKDKIGVFGVSMGAIKASLLASLDHRISACVLGLVGGDIPYILSYSNEGGVVEKRDEYMKSHHLTQDEFYEALKKTVTCDPLNYAQYIDADKVMMILAWLDRTVPYRTGRQLWEKMGEPENIRLLSGHYTAYLYISYVKCQSLKFFKKCFDIQ